MKYLIKFELIINYDSYYLMKFILGAGINRHLINYATFRYIYNKNIYYLHILLAFPLSINLAALYYVLSKVRLLGARKYG